MHNFKEHFYIELNQTIEKRGKLNQENSRQTNERKTLNFYLRAEAQEPKASREVSDHYENTHCLDPLYTNQCSYLAIVRNSVN